MKKILSFTVCLAFGFLASCGGGETTGSPATTPPTSTLPPSTPPDTQAPSPPAGFAATVFSDSRVTLSWSASTDNVAVTGYRIYRCPGAACTPLAQVGTASASPYNDTGLTASTVYRYFVRAHDAVPNLSGNSATVSATTSAVMPPPPPSGSAPTIQQIVSGTFSHKNTVTVSGSGFGTKTTPAPVVWDDAAGTDLSTLWSGWWPTAGTASYRMTYSTPIRGVTPPHSHVTKYLTGAHGDSSGSNAGWNVAVWKDFTKSDGQVLYWSWYHRVDPAWVFGLGSPNDANFKTFGYSAQGSIYEMPNNWYSGYQPSNFVSTSATMCVGTNDDSSATFQSPDLNGHNAFWWDCVANANPATGWVKSEMEFRISTTNGYIKQWENGTLVVNYAGPTDKYPGTARSVGIGGYHRGYGNANNRRYFGDVYFDTTPARIILGNANTLAASTIREVQIPTAWTANSISFSVNLGKFTTGQSAYLFIVDPSGVSSATGFPVTIN